MRLVEQAKGQIETQASSLLSVVASAGCKALDLKTSTYSAVEGRAIAIRDVVTSAGEKAQKIIGESTVVVRAHKTSLAFVDTLDMLIDRYLPDPEIKDGDDGSSPKGSEAVIPRMLRIPIKIPARMIKIAVLRAQDGYDLIQVKIKWSIELTRDQKEKLKSLVLTKSKAIADKASSSSLAVKLQIGKTDAARRAEALLKSIDDGKNVIGAKCYVVCERLYIIEVKDWTLKTFDSSMVVASSMLAGASRRVYDVTSMIGGQDLAKGIFTVVGKRLPFVKNAIRESASTGSLSDTSSTEESEQKLASGTGTTVPATVLASPSEEVDDSKPLP